MEKDQFKRRVAILAATTTTKELRTTAIELLGELGFTRWIYAAENPYGVLGFPSTLANEFGKWMIEYMTKGYLKVDPIVSHCRASTEPYFWDAAAEVPEAGGKLQAMMRDLAANGFHSGMAIGMHPPGEPPGLLHVTSAHALAEARAQFEEALPRLQLLGNAMHEANVRILKKNAKYLSQDT